MKFDDHKDLFLEEARELLGNLETALMELEEHPERSSLINDVFRALHTIKGSGAMFGFDNVAQFTHSVEGLFDEIRKGLISINPEIINIGLRSADCIRLLLETTDAGEDQVLLLKEIAALEQKPYAFSPETLEKALPQISKSSSEEHQLPHVFRISVKPDPLILHRGVKLEALFQELQEMGLYHCSLETSEVPDLVNLNPSDINLHWNLTISTVQSEQAIRSVFMFVEDYAQITIENIDLDAQNGEPSIPKVGEVLLRRGMLKEHEIQTIRQEQRPFGEVAVASGLLQQKDLDAALAEQEIVKSTSVEREVRQESTSIRVRKEKLDFLIDAVGELVILQARLQQEAKKAGISQFEGISENLARLSATLRDSTMSIRMVPLEESFSGFQRLVRDLSKQLKKDLFLEIHGASTELDKNIIESLKDPLVHIIRNSADHGIEPAEVRSKNGKPKTGTISITASQVGSNVEIEIRDDGAGLNLDRIKARAVEKKLLDPTETDVNKIMGMIFAPGFSTAEKTTGVSGRGVGMDVVKTNIEKLRGEIALSSEPGKGTRIVLSIPLTLVIVDGLLVKVAGVDYVLTLSLVQECVDFTQDIQGGNKNHRIIHLRGKTIPVVDLHHLLTGTPADSDQDCRLVITNIDNSPVALKVDSVTGKQQVVIKPFTMALRQIPLVSGATILGDGSVALILNTNELVKTKEGAQR